MTERHKIFGVPFDDISTQEITDLFLKWLNGAQAKIVFTPNPEFLLKSRKDSDFTNVLNQSDLSLADGVGVKFAISALTNRQLKNRQTGIDALILLAGICSMTNKKLVLLGGKNFVSQSAANILKKRFHNLNVDSVDLGLVLGNSESVSISDELTNEIIKSEPNVLAVALSFGKQERFILEISQKIPSLKIIIGVGGAFDTISGRLKRAPLWMRKNGLEWLWRVIIEPKRICRILNAVVVFPLLVIWDKLKQHK
ncbi:WecB/TagA/CpsF family glycosyltransferase [Candidatus Uhrbacteria bacterium]|nr:WecB/TagA/CpsF family glycosyltransferase [Candidatus Uhrbacteria bacterium]